MAISQTIWSLDDKVQLQPAELINEKELEDLLAEHIEILNIDWLLIGRQVRTVAGKYIDLLCMDHDGDLVVVELKKDLTPREVTAQAIDYASCMAELTLEELAELYLQFSGGQMTLNDAYEKKYGTTLDEDTQGKVHAVGGSTVWRYEMKKSWTKRDPIKNYFPVPNEIYSLGLSSDAISIYGYLLSREDRKTYQSSRWYRWPWKWLGSAPWIRACPT